MENMQNYYDFKTFITENAQKDNPQNNRARLRMSVDHTKKTYNKKIKDMGVMLDCSRNAVPKLETIKQFIRYLSYMGYDFLGLYLEDTLKINHEPYVGYQRGAYTIQDIQGLDAYAKEYGIELRPYIQTLAHLNQIVRYEEYQQMIDVDDILLVGDARTHAFLEHLFETISQAFTTKKVNIGMDEAFMVGFGKYLEKNGYQNRLEIMQRHLKDVLAIASQYGYQVQMWSDMFFRLVAWGGYYNLSEEQIAKIQVPPNVTLAYWDYYSTDTKHYSDNIRIHKQISSHVACVGGAWKWTGFVPHNQYSIHACKAMIQASIEHEVSEITFAAWGDDGAETSIFAILPTLFENAKQIYEDQMSDECFKILTGISIQDFLELDHVNPCIKDGYTHNNASKYFLYNDLLQGVFDSVAQVNMIDEINQTKQHLIKLKTQDKYLKNYFTTIIALCDVLACKLNLGNEIYQAYQDKNMQTLENITNKQLPKLVTYIDTFYQAFYTQWHTENHNQGFEVQTIRIGGLKQRIIDVQRQLQAYLKGEVTSIDELEEQHLEFHYFNDHAIERLNYNLWSHTVTTSKL